MDLRQLEVFLAVMEHTTVTRTAEVLRVSPGAVSLQLKALRQELRTPLFVRSGKRILPTPHAFRFAEHAREVMRRMAEIHRDFADAPSEDSRPFHFASGATTLIYRLGPPLRTLRRRFPHADLHVTVSPTERIVDGLIDRKFDLGLISLPFNQPDLTILPLYQEELLVIRPTAAVTSDASVSAIQTREMASAPFLLYPHGSNMRAIIERYFHDLGITPRVIMEADDTEVIKRLVESGFGYSILPQYALSGRGHRFQKLRVPGRRLVRQQALAMAKTEYPRALTARVADFLKAALGDPNSAAG
ncbi:MAG TPA: LysR family transcriptional regulator [Bryobacteraceae bacterium]|nr:LysR family transcriptional regulator [Bryobacteraceae bacterium]